MCIGINYKSDETAVKAIIGRKINTMVVAASKNNTLIIWTYSYNLYREHAHVFLGGSGTPIVDMGVRYGLISVLKGGIVLYKLKGVQTPTRQEVKVCST